ncbi:iron-siderophore ABC transporter substrate-binding protein [Paenibacillus sp. CF384]|uniref:iron-siderophore ABC transporter substrate-binding protein n=1 Tax=Paenibacillus sp. CF384 TaxID=1884382 RepID=UPI0008957EEB|nr:iron-siderophore ABC transporter substrate-binding protein [Paenibacillus sp. CF384]SDX55389.1 iron complex transport system substrate-binding protein [Paenibacillus sp. CF384]
MKSKRKFVVSTLLASLTLMLALTGCGSNNNTNSNAANTTNSGATNSNVAANAPASNETASEEATQQYPITIKHAFGETVLEKKPERIATISWANQDVALALGVVPVGFSAANYGVTDGSGLLPWTKKKLDELGSTSPNIYQDTDGLDFEAISDSKPDVILAAYSGLTKEDYETLSKIAPVVAYQKSPWVTSWQEMIKFDSMGMGMEAEGEQLIKDTENVIKEKASAYPDLQGKNALFAFFYPDDMSKVSIYAPGDPRGDFLVELGMKYSESVLSKVSKDSFYFELSAENADILNDTDIIVTYGDEALLKKLQADPLLGKIPAIAKGSMVLIKDNTPLAAAGNPNPLSISYTLDEYLKLIDAAAKKANG